MPHTGMSVCWLGNKENSFHSVINCHDIVKHVLIQFGDKYKAKAHFKIVLLAKPGYIHICSAC